MPIDNPATSEEMNQFHETMAQAKLNEANNLNNLNAIQKEFTDEKQQMDRKQWVTGTALKYLPLSKVPLVGDISTFAHDQLWKANIEALETYYSNKKAALTESQQQQAQALLETFKVNAQAIRQKQIEGFASHQPSSSIALAGVQASKDMMDIINNAKLSPEVKSIFMGAQLQFIQDNVIEFNTFIGTATTTFSQLKVRDVAQQTQINQIGTAVSNLGNQFGKLKDYVSDLTKRVNVNDAQIKTLQSHMNGVIGVLKNHESRIEDLEFVANLSFDQLSKVSTGGLEAYDQAIGDMLTQYDILKATAGVSKEAIIAQKSKIEAQVALRFTEAGFVKEKIDMALGLASFVGQVGQIVGSARLQQAATIAQGVIQIGTGIAALAGVGGTALPALLGMSAAAGPFAPAMLIAGGVMTIFSSFMSKKDNGMAKAIQQLSEQIQNLSRQVDSLGRYIGQRFDRIEDLLADQQRVVLDSFKDMVKLLNRFEKNMLEQFMETQGRVIDVEVMVQDVLNELTRISSVIENGFITLYKQDYQRIKTQIINYYLTNIYGTVPSLNPIEVKQAELSLVDWGTNGATDRIMHGDLADDYTLARVMDVDPEQPAQKANLLLGILRSSQGLNLSLNPKALPANMTQPINQFCSLTPSGIRVINPAVWQAAVNDLMTLVARTPELVLTKEDRCLVQRLIDGGENYLRTVLGLKTHNTLFPTLVNNYENAWIKLNDFVYRTIVEKLKVRREDFNIVLGPALPILQSTQALLGKLTSNANDFKQVVSTVHRLIVDNCWLWGDYPDPQKFPVGQGICDFDVWSASKTNPIYVGAYPAYLPIEYRSYTINQLSRDVTNCHSFLNVQRSKKYRDDYSSQAAQFIEIIGKNIAAINSVLNANNETGVRWDDLLLQQFPDYYYSAYPYNIANASMSFLFINLYTPLTNIDQSYENFFLKEITQCYKFFMCGAASPKEPCTHAHNYHMYDYKPVGYDIKRELNIMIPLQDNVPQARRVAALISKQESDIIQNVNQFKSYFPVFKVLLTKAQQLRTEEIYYSNLPLVQRNEWTLRVLNAWFKEYSTVEERALVMQTLLNAMNAGEFKLILDQLSISLRALQAYLPLAFNEDFQGDPIIRQLLFSLVDGNEVVSLLAAYNPNDPASFPLLGLRDLFYANATTNVFNSTRVYLQNAVANAQALQAKNQLFPVNFEIQQTLTNLYLLRDVILPQGNSLPTTLRPPVTVTNLEITSRIPGESIDNPNVGQGNSRQELSGEAIAGIAVGTAIVVAIAIIATACVIISNKENKSQASSSQASSSQASLAAQLLALGVQVQQLTAQVSEAASLVEPSILESTPDIPGSPCTSSALANPIIPAFQSPVDGSAKLYGQAVFVNDQAALVVNGDSYSTLVFAKPEVQTPGLVIAGTKFPEGNIQGDTYDKASCRPVEFNGRPSVVCDGNETTMVYQGRDSEAHQAIQGQYSNLSSNLALAAVTWQAYRSVKNAVSSWWYGGDEVEYVNTETAAMELQAYDNLLVNYASDLAFAKLNYPKADWWPLEDALEDHRESLQNLVEARGVTQEDLDNLQGDVEAYYTEFLACMDEAKASALTLQGVERLVCPLDQELDDEEDTLTGRLEALSRNASRFGLERGFFGGQPQQGRMIEGQSRVLGSPAYRH